ncbi:MAG: cytochrome c [Bacteroidota bacterium]|nr:cytochrome c [Bacteroidota bacterium]
MMKFYLSICILNALFLVSCSGSLPEPTSEQVQWASNKWSGISISELSEGRNLYIDKCSGCHSLKDPSDYTEEEWGTVLKKMSRKAKLTDAEYEKISHYISTMSKRQ